MSPLRGGGAEAASVLRRGFVLALAGGEDWIPAMAGSLHPPCRRKKLRPLRPRLTARTPLCSVPSSSPHKIFDFAGAPVFIPRIKRENGPCTVQKRKTRGCGLRGRGRGADGFSTQVSSPRRSAGGSFAGRCKDFPSLPAAANLAVYKNERAYRIKIGRPSFFNTCQGAAAKRERRAFQ